MHKIKFLVDRRLLAYRYCVNLFTNQDQLGGKLRRKLERLYGDYAGFYIFVPGQMQDAILPDWRDGTSKAPVRFLVRDISIVESALADIIASHEFRAIYQEAQAYLSRVRSCWENHSLVVAHYFTDLFREQRDTILRVLVFPPRMKVGSYLGANTIEWGSADIYPGYQAIGLAHEAMHALTEHLNERATESKKWLLHALIYLAVDEDLRICLFGRPGPFDPGLTSHYHPRLVALARKILPQWRKRRNDSQGIEQIYKALQITDDDQLSNVARERKIA